MDTSYWKNKNNSIRFEETTKQFFGKYLYRLKMSVPGGRIIYENRDYAEAVEAELKAISIKLGAKYNTALLSISGPASDSTQQLLKTGVIIRKKEFGYKYKIILRDCRCEIDTKQQILNYMEGMGADEVKVSAGTKRMLGSKYNGFWGIWFYANDEKVITFLELIHPGCVLNIHPVVIA